MSEELTSDQLFQPYIDEDDERGPVEETKKYLTFISDNLVFGVDSDYVLEIITNHDITMLPMVPNFIKGIINLRGMVIPIIDIRARMNKPMAEPTDKTCIIVLEIDSESIGIYVDEVWQVADVVEKEISPLPSNNAQELVSGMVSLTEETVMLVLDYAQLIATN